MVGHNRTAVDPVRAVPLGVDGWHCSTRALALLLVPTDRLEGHMPRSACVLGAYYALVVCAPVRHTPLAPTHAGQGPAPAQEISNF